MANASVVAVIGAALYAWIAVISAKDLAEPWGGHLLYRVIDISVLLLAPSIAFDTLVKIVLALTEKYFPPKAGVYKLAWPITAALATLFFVLEIIFVVTKHAEWRLFLRNVLIVGLNSLYATYDFWSAARELREWK
ncbi:hypothetical protein Q8F55_002825 [Vanrija albida]|uniref:MARVEL domain-containing protein n=1 Tax=Vanrija albida TaxID=181172 RepID=A0ABR3QAY3_9TREE